MGENGITISGQGKEVKVTVFEDVDLISDEEKAAMAAEDEEAGAGSDDEAALDEAAAAEDAAAAAAAKADLAAKKTQEDVNAEETAKKDAEASAALEKEKADAAAKAAEADPDKAAKEAGAAGGPDAASSDTQANAKPAIQPPVMMDVMSVEDVEAVNAKLEEVEEKFKNGEIDYQEHMNSRLDLERQLWQNDVASQLSTDSVENQWQWQQDTFLNDNVNGWINNDEVIYSAFAATVNRLMSTDEGSVMPGPELLEKARSEVSARFSPTREQDAAAADEKKKAADAIVALKKAQAGKVIPDTLGGVPAAEPEEGEGEFSYIDKLEGEQFERAVEALSPSQLAKYENTI